MKTTIIGSGFAGLSTAAVLANKGYDVTVLEKNKDIEQLGIFQESSNAITIIEWPEKINREVKNRLEITFYYEDVSDKRKIKLQGFGKWSDFKIDEI